MPNQVDIAILITLKEEFSLFYAEIDQISRPVRDQEGNFLYEFDYPAGAASRAYHCVTTLAGQMGPTKAGLITQRLLRDWQPATLVMLGIAGALDSWLALGDVVAATQVDAYLEHARAAAAASGGYSFDFGGEVFRCSPDLLNLVRNFEFAYGADYQRWREACAADLGRLLLKPDLDQAVTSKVVHAKAKLSDGHIASGPVVGAAEPFTAWLKTRDRKYVAIEMEAAGLMQAVYEQVSPTRTLVLRGISDFADERKEQFDRTGMGSFRVYAMRNATRLLFQLMEVGAFPHAVPANPHQPPLSPRLDDAEKRRLKARVTALTNSLAELQKRRDSGRLDEGRYTDLATDLDRERLELISRLEDHGPYS